MANFGFARLSVVAPYERHWDEAMSDPHWREAKSAVGASDLLQNAKRTESLADAVADCTLVVGTGSLEHRKPEQPVVPLPDLAPLIRKSSPAAAASPSSSARKSAASRERPLALPSARRHSHRSPTALDESRPGRRRLPL